MTKKYKYALLLLLVIFGIGFFLRTYRLEQNIPELYSDEVGHYYYLENIKNGSVGIIRRISYLFFTASWFAGLNPFGVRLMSAIFGSLTIIAGFYFAKVLSKKSGSQLYLRVALMFALLLAILPWNIAISRLGHTHVPIIVFTSLLHLFLYLSSKTVMQKILSFVPFLIGSYYYPTLILMSPLILLIPAKELVWDNQKYRKQVLFFGSVFIAITIAFLISKYQVFNSSSRGLDLAIWRDVNVTADSNLYRGIARNTDPSIFSFYKNPEDLANKILFNYPLSVVSVFFKNYLSFFSTENLFLRGDTILRHSTSMTGNFYSFLLPFMVYGSYLFFSSKTKNKYKWLIGLWLLAAPIPSAITKDGANYLLRAISLYPILTYFCALGLVFSFEIFKNKTTKVIYGLSLFLVFLFSIYYYFFGYFHVYPSLAKDSFEYGFKALSDFQKETNSTLLITWEDMYPYIQFCFWQKLPFEECDTVKSDQKREVVGDSRVDNPLKQVYFSLPTNEKDLLRIIDKYIPQYLVLSERYKNKYDNFFAKIKPERTILNPDKTVSFYIYKLNTND